MSSFALIVNTLAVLLSAFGLIQAVPRIRRILRYWPLLRFWKYGGRQTVWIICSEADNPEVRQWPEPREFIYFLKYGDVDALFETTITLERIYQNLNIRIMSSGEFQQVTGNFPTHMIAIGGPDYNALTARLIQDNRLSVGYRSPYVEELSQTDPAEIVLIAPDTEKEFFETEKEKDFGYIERIENPWSTGGTITVLGGNHTIGVAAAAKMFSVLEEGRFSITARTRSNFRHLRKTVGKSRYFYAIFPAEKVGAVIVQPDLSAAVILTANE